MARPGTFGDLMSLHDLGALLDLGTAASFRRGDVVLREGDAAHNVAMLHDGWVKIARTGGAVLNVCRAGDVIGEFGVLDGQPRAADAIALTPLTVTVIDAERFHAFLSERTDLMSLLHRVLVARLRHAGDSASDLHQPVIVRLARRLTTLADDHGTVQPDGSVAIDAGLSQHDLASWVGASREATARALQRLRRQDLVRTGQRTIVVVDPDRLRALGD